MVTILVKVARGPYVLHEIDAGRFERAVNAFEHGQRFRLRKRGVPRLGEEERGDLWVEARIVIPAVTGDRGRKLLRELADEVPPPPDGGDETAPQARSRS